MEGKRGKIIGLFLIVLMIAPLGSAFGEGYEALQGVTSIKAVFDVRTSNPKSGAVYLSLIHDTFKEKNVRAADSTPDIVVEFIGPAVKLVSTNREGFSAEDQKYLDQIAGRISAMAKDGIKLEICGFAANLLGVDLKSILPEIKHVDNGWIALIGYQANGYSLVPAY